MLRTEFTTVLVPVDFSDESMAAVDAALELAGDPQRIHVVHVLPQISGFEIGMVDLADYDRERCDRALHELRSRLSPEKYRGIDLQVALGDAPRQIVKAAELAGATLILMPSHGRTGCRHFLLGSVAERVIRLAQCPVLVLKSQRNASVLQTESSVVRLQPVAAH